MSPVNQLSTSNIRKWFHNIVNRLRSSTLKRYTCQVLLHLQPFLELFPVPSPGEGERLRMESSTLSGEKNGLGCLTKARYKIQRSLGTSCTVYLLVTKVDMNPYSSKR